MNGDIQQWESGCNVWRCGRCHPSDVQVETLLTPSGWVFVTEDETAIHESAVVSVAEIGDGRVVAAWTVRDHSLDGRKEINP